MKNLFKLLFILIACIAFSESALAQNNKTPQLANSSSADTIKKKTVVDSTETPKLSVAGEGENVSKKKKKKSQPNSNEKPPEVGVMNKKEKVI